MPLAGSTRPRRTVEKGVCGRVRLQARRRQIQRRALTLSVSILSAARPESSLRCCDKVVVVAARPLAVTVPAAVDRLLPVARERDALMERAAALDSIVQCGRADAAQKSGCWNGADSAEANPASGQGPPRLGPAGGLLRTQVVTNGHTRIRARTSESLRYTEGFNGARDRYGFLPHRVSNSRSESTSIVYLLFFRPSSIFLCIPTTPASPAKILGLDLAGLSFLPVWGVAGLRADGAVWAFGGYTVCRQSGLCTYYTM